MPKPAMRSAAIYYHPEAYSTSGPKLMGRNAAGESFLRGYFAHVKVAELWAQVHLSEHAQAFAAAARQAGRAEPIKAVDKSNLAALAAPGTVYFPGPGIGEHAWQRAAFGHGKWSLCGITHTTSSAGAMDAMADLLTAPVQPWDAVICTSTAVKDNVTRLLQAQADYLVQRLGVQRVVLPQLPVILWAFTRKTLSTARSNAPPLGLPWVRTRKRTWCSTWVAYRSMPKPTRWPCTRPCKRRQRVCPRGTRFCWWSAVGTPMTLSPRPSPMRPAWPARMCG
ncbi:MAG: hypothetical protein IPG23_05780 [Burkholderiales bacterium]|nr:hypothetical protein [Burkholderiales bacterium]